MLSTQIASASPPSELGLPPKSARNCSSGRTTRRPRKSSEERIEELVTRTLESKSASASWLNQGER